MEINDLRIFSSLYHTLSITATAKQLSYTQSNVSTRLMKLETELGRRFFTRSHRGLSPLDAADRLMIYIGRIEDNLSDLYQEFSLANSTLHVGATQLLSRLYFADLVTADSNPELFTLPVKELHRSFLQHSLDTIFTHTRLALPTDEKTSPSSRNPYLQDIHMTPLEHQTLIWALSSSYKNKDKETDSTDILSYSLLINRDKDCPLRAASLNFIQTHKLNLSLIEVDTLDLMFSLLSSIPSIALLPEKLCKNYDSINSKSFPKISLPIYRYDWK